MFKFFKNKVDIPQLAKAIVIESKKISVNGWTHSINYAVFDEFTINKDIKISIDASERTKDEVFNHTNYFRLFMYIKVKDIEVAVFQLDNQLKGNWETSWAEGLNFDFDKTHKDIIHELTEGWILIINSWSRTICDKFNEEFDVKIAEEKSKFQAESKKLYTR